MEIRITCETKHYSPLEDLHPIQGELKTLSAENFAKLKNQIINEGFSFPMFIWDDNGMFRLLDGHQRFATLVKLKSEGYEIPELPIVKIQARDLTHAKKKLLAVTSSYAKITKDGLTDFLGDMDTSFLDNIELEGIDDFEFLNPIDEEKDSKEDEVPEVEENPIVKRGEVWLLGDHRILCGDSTVKEDVDKLMNGEKADMVFTDPPYGMNYSGRGANTSSKILNDDIDPTVFYNLLPEMSERYVWGRFENYAHLAEKPRDVIIWRKNNFGMGRGYRGQYECCFYYGSFSGSDSDVWDVPRDRDYVHPTQKPVALCERAIRNSKPEGVIDLFLGSGSTLIACEKTNRKCYGMELDEKYCDVIIKRFQEYSGKEAIRESDGATFNNLHSEQLTQRSC